MVLVGAGWLLVISVISMVSYCGFAGGRCPSEPTPLFSDDGTVFAFAATAIAGVVLLVVSRRTRSAAAWVAVLAASLVVALVVRSL